MNSYDFMPFPALFRPQYYNYYIIFVITQVSIWVLFYTLMMLAAESTHLIHLLTRFTQDIFDFLIAVVFITDAIKKLLQVCDLNI